MKYLQSTCLGTLVLAVGSLFASAPTANAQELPPSWREMKGTEDFSAARIWNEELLFAIRRDTARPVVHARNLLHTSICAWDVWAAYDATATGFLVKEKLTPPGTPEDLLAARSEAISFACYRLLINRFTASPGSVASLAEFDATMDELGYDKTNTSTVGDTPAAFGNRIAAAVIAWGLTDNANQQANYAANNGYEPINPPLVVKLYGNPACSTIEGEEERDAHCIVDPNRWQPLALDFFVDQGGIVLGAYPKFIGPHWGYVTPFALRERDRSENGVHLDPGPPPQFGTETHQEYIDNLVAVIEATATLTPDDGVLKDISPASLGNNSIGADDGTGYDVNPVTGQPYTPEVVKRGDWARVIAEFWADGPASETPPGHWNTLANYASDNIAEKRLGGEGEVLDNLEWDVKLYLALNGALHDAAIVAWGTKGRYDGVRPISGIRHVCELGQSSNPELPNYDPLGMPLIDGLIELITLETTAPGERHEHLAGEEGQIAVFNWPNVPVDTENDYSGVTWYLCGDWIPYQRPTFVSPPFAGYISGHSTYSFSAAEVLSNFTGSKYFPGGLGSFLAEQNVYLKFEDGPSEDVELQWATYYDAASEAATSRIVGGIHWPVDNYPAQFAGQEAGALAFHEAQKYWGGDASYHVSDTDQDSRIGLDELLRSIQLYNIGEYGCQQETEDGYAPGISGEVVLGECYPHDGDYAPADFTFSLSELLRMIQFFNVGEYVFCNTKNPATEDSFCCPTEI